jgi:protocatechuate 3,4-dioxygenase beta subunit
VATRKRTLALLGLLSLLLAGGGVWLAQRGRDKGRAGQHNAGAGGATGAGAGTGTFGSRTTVTALPPGFAATGVAPRRIAGRVTFAGKAFTGATVLLRTWGGQLAVADDQRVTGADGAFDLGTRPAANYQVVAEAPGKLAAIALVELANPAAMPAPDQLELVLRDCAAWVVGTIRDPSGGPIARARVLRGGVAGVEADDNGAYELCVPPGESTIDYGADGYGSVTLTFSADLRTRRDVVLVPEAVVQGVVLDDDGAPVAGAYVWLNPVEWGSERNASRSAVAEDDGRFRVAEVTPGRVRLSAYADGLATETAQEALAEVGTSPDVILRMVRQTTISGRVVRAGAPAAGVELVGVRKSPAKRSRNTYSQADGTFVLDRVGAGDIVITSPHYKVRSPQVVTVGRAPVTDVVVEIEAMARIHGTVTRKGLPVEGVTMCCLPQLGATRVTSDVDGKYAYEGVEPGTYQIMAASDRAGAFAEAKTVEVAAGQEYRVDLELAGGAIINGKVVDERGAPVTAVRVQFMHAKTDDQCNATTDDSGRFRCTSMLGGSPYTAKVFANATATQAMTTPPGKPYPTIDLADGATTVDGVTITVIDARGAIRGRVLDTAGQPVADARVKASAEQRFWSWMALPSAITDGDGSFAIERLHLGTYDLQARATDGATGVLAGVATAGPPVVIRVTRPGAIAGALLGYPAAPAVYAAPTGAYTQLIAGSVTGDAYRIGGLEPGRYLVSAQTTFEGSARVVEVKAGETTTLDLTAGGRGAIDATVLDWATKAPVARIACHVVVAVDGLQGLTNWDLATAPASDAAGKLRFDPAPAGEVIVGCQSPQRLRSSPSAALTLARGATAKVELWSVALTGDDVWLGLEMDWRSVPPRLSGVTAGSAAAAAGLQPGDLVTAVDDAPVGDLDGQGVQYLVASHAAGARIPITVKRGAQSLRVVVEAPPAK